eukprot:NODE_876_length_1397_cov_157.373145_g731_i0.p4 GENE.NODE_876_length_1397_cov_157.373145_g731_i0~~NODE_876_length_1397_cov_157.373145_g731_i0.p4  ORF type:complete len:76 (+),score=11.96 NODE_876_length_1397_cov_157.373145_g731_i0:984-1211(+)
MPNKDYRQLGCGEVQLDQQWNVGMIGWCQYVNIGTPHGQPICSSCGAVAKSELGHSPYQLTDTHTHVCNVSSHFN